MTALARPAPSETGTDLPTKVRYIKLGEGGQWWPISKARNEIHLGWSCVPHALIQTPDYSAIEAHIRAEVSWKGRATQDYNGLLSLLDKPSRYLWMTFQDGDLWWCTVRDDPTVNPGRKSKVSGHFWLTCALPWSNKSLGGSPLAMANLPGVVTSTAAYRATTCEPGGAKEILRLILDEIDPDKTAADGARRAYEQAMGALVAKLHDKDFELLVDLILARTGWTRIAKLGGAIEGIDVEVENISVGEIAFVQVKSVADQSILDDYVERFGRRRDRYQRMIFAVHTPKGSLALPPDPSLQLWTGSRIAELVVKLGLADWVANRI